MVQYAHVSVQLDLQKAMGEVKEACENIQRTTEHVRRKAEGMDIVVIHVSFYNIKLFLLHNWYMYVPCLLYTSPSPRDS